MSEPINTIEVLAKTAEKLGQCPVRIRIEVWDENNQTWHMTERGYQLEGLSPAGTLALIESVETWAMKWMNKIKERNT